MFLFDFGNVTSYTITSLGSGLLYAAVTAYDSGYNSANDDSSTIVNENQTNGNESWYSEEVQYTTTSSTTTTTSTTTSSTTTTTTISSTTTTTTTTSSTTSTDADTTTTTTTDTTTTTIGTVFYGIAEGYRIVLKWETKTETFHLMGFNILRAEAEDGEFVKISKKLIPAKGNATMGASYSFIDKKVTLNTTYYYKLEEIGGTASPPVVRIDNVLPNITLLSFTAVAKENVVIVKWKTITEKKKTYFNILRSENENGDYVKINKRFIPNKGNRMRGAVYIFNDKSIELGKTYYYKLEDIDKKNVSTFHGPVSVEVNYEKVQ